MSDAPETSASRGRSLANLRPWVKGGPSGNPNGRPKALVDIAALAREHGPRCIDVAVALLDDPDPRIRLATVVALLDRGFGKPVQSITAENGAGLTFMHLVAMRDVGDQILKERNIEGRVIVADETKDAGAPKPRDLMEPALE
jgi:hypothetical protein